MRLIVLLLLASCARSGHVERAVEAPVPVPEVSSEASEAYRRGAQLYRTASCVGCHSPPFAEAEHLGGGRDLPTIFGVFYAPNISPDPTHGIGTWSRDDFGRAMREGRAPDGRRYWPTFPYMSYTKMSEDDIDALWAYLSKQPPSSVRSREHDVRAPYSFPGMLGLWRSLAFSQGPLEPDPTESDAWNRGRYLVKAVSYCDQCHTPRNQVGLMQRRRYLAGGANPGKADVHPNLTPDPEVGLGSWSAEDIADYLETGTKPDGSTSNADKIMGEKIHDSFRYHSTADRLAIGTYLKSLEPNRFDPETWGLVKRERRKAARRERRAADSE